MDFNLHEHQLYHQSGLFQNLINSFSLKNNIMNKPIFTSLLLVLLLNISCKNQTPAEEIKQSFVLSDKMLETTKTAIAENKMLQNELTFHGKITTDNNKFIEIFPIVGGSVTKVYVELGDYVKKGQLLATIKSTEVASFEKELEDAKSDVLVAKNNLKVAQELFDGKLSTNSEVIHAKSELEKAQSQLNRIQETYKIYNIKGSSTFEVRSPLDGFIIQKNINQDMLLRNDKSDNIFDIAEIDDVWAIANVNESDINQVKLGIDASVTTLSYPDKKFHGKVDKIFNIIDPETKAMKVRIKLSNPNFLLKPEMRASIKLSYDENTSMIAIPSEAVIFDKSKNFVMIFKDRNNIETRQVEVYRQLSNVTFISSGLNEGEKVITENQILIYDALNN
jgi:cobalt-zinc-cadmium efflux system membrane fusion protein